MQTKLLFLTLVFIVLLGFKAFSQEGEKSNLKVDQKHFKLVIPKKTVKKAPTLAVQEPNTSVKSSKLQQSINNPIYLLNGEPIEDINVLNPNDIIDITVEGNSVSITTQSSKNKVLKHSLVSN